MEIAPTIVHPQTKTEWTRNVRYILILYPATCDELSRGRGLIFCARKKTPLCVSELSAWTLQCSRAESHGQWGLNFDPCMTRCVYSKTKETISSSTDTWCVDGWILSSFERKQWEGPDKGKLSICRKPMDLTRYSHCRVCQRTVSFLSKCSVISLFCFLSKYSVVFVNVQCRLHQHRVSFFCFVLFFVKVQCRLCQGVQKSL